jgi:hypothetical protein
MIFLSPKGTTHFQKHPPCAEEIFGRTWRYKKSYLVTSPKIQAMVASMRSVDGAIRHVKSGFKTAIAFQFLNALSTTKLSALRHLSLLRRIFGSTWCPCDVNCTRTCMRRRWGIFSLGQSCRIVVYPFVACCPTHTSYLGTTPRV